VNAAATKNRLSTTFLGTVYALPETILPFNNSFIGIPEANGQFITSVA